MFELQTRKEVTVNHITKMLTDGQFSIVDCKSTQSMNLAGEKFIRSVIKFTQLYYNDIETIYVLNFDDRTEIVIQSNKQFILDNIIDVFINAIGGLVEYFDSTIFYPYKKLFDELKLPNRYKLANEIKENMKYSNYDIDNFLDLLQENRSIIEKYNFGE